MDTLLKVTNLSKAFAGVQALKSVSFELAGRLGKIEIQGDNILLGKPFTFTKENIDRFDF